MELHVHINASTVREQYNERNDCTIWSLLTVARISYDRALRIGRAAGRRPRCGFYPDRLLAQAQQENVVKAVRVATLPMTVESFAARNPVGRFYISTRTHSIAIIDGTLYDNLPRGSAKRRVRAAWKVELPTA
jgi:hypothetical protein